ncbi:MAG: AAA family ATPase, partial [Candidatus Woesearchaeota archaeon]
RHVIVEGAPGIGKTTLVKSIPEHLPDLEVVKDCSYHCDPKNPICPECISKVKAGEKLYSIMLPGSKRFVRIQGSPDLTVEDLLGDIDPTKAMKFGPASIEAFTPGKIFKANRGVLFFDEINRCPEKLQNALLQVLEEGYATIGSYDVDLPTNFIFIGTMNPQDSTGTEKLSDVFLDRFDIIKMTYPENVAIETEILKEHAKRLKEVEISNELIDILVNFVRNLRNPNKVERMPSVRATIGLYETAQSNALVRGVKIVEFIDLKNAFETVLVHRIKLKPSLKYLMTTSDFINKELASFVESKPEYAKFSKYMSGSSGESERP